MEQTTNLIPTTLENKRNEHTKEQDVNAQIYTVHQSQSLVIGSNLNLKYTAKFGVKYRSYLE